ncbi:cysteine proteinase inhibitor B-like [Cornus florida]|uniref:cysteine proteinase inhibitor B-like n=1 Tax=Cornus florida TaxID=4283 RepID=UPI00289FE2F8|nr:cysteine proteinase inhibitor B-like [Cornus florida]
MAKHSPSAKLTKATITFLAILLVLAYCSTPVRGLRGLVGVRTKIEDVKGNREVQELGRYSVKEYNRSRRRSNGGGEDLRFMEVVEAERQVVSGIKYYLKVAAAADARQSGGAPRTFDAVVVVKPWVQSKKLIDFAPSTASSN